MPMAAPAIMILKFRACQVLRYAQTLNRSITHKIGNMIAAARGAEITSDMNGTPNMARPPPNPPFEIAAKRTAGIATR